MAYRALLIGVSEYDNLPGLQGPAQEAAFLGDVLRSSLGSLLVNDEVLVFQNPTLAQAQDQLFAILARADAEDTVLIYLSGHGLVDRDETYLLLADTDTWSVSGGLSANIVSAALERTRASSVLLMLNTSFAGSFQLPDSPRLKDSPTSYYFIGSVGPTEQATDLNPFAEALAGAIRSSMELGKDLNPDYLFSFVSDRLAPEGIHPFYAARGIKARERPQPPPTPDQKSIFVSYAHEDERWLKKLRPHLENLARDVAEISYWDDKKIKPGEDWHQEIQDRLGVARAAVLLVSADFLASEFIRNDELPKLLSRAESRRTRLFCLIIRPCRFDKVALLSRFQAVNGPDKTLSEMRPPEQERSFLRLTDQLEQALR